MSITTVRPLLVALVTCGALLSPAAALAVRPPSTLAPTPPVPAQSPAQPTTGPDGKTYLCREDEEAKQSICIEFVWR